MGGGVDSSKRREVKPPSCQDLSSTEGSGRITVSLKEGVWLAEDRMGWKRVRRSKGGGKKRVFSCLLGETPNRGLDKEMPSFTGRWSESRRKRNGKL